VRLDSGERLVDSEILKVSKAKSPARPLSCYPIISNGAALTADARYVRAFELRSGKMHWQFDLLADRKVPGADELRFLSAAPRELSYTLTAADGYLCARMGSPWFGPLRDGEKRIGQSWLVCFNIPSGPTALPTVCWVEPASGKAGEQIAFEGTPLIHHKAVYVAQSRVKGNRTATSICCFDAQSGLLRWEQEICEAAEFSEGAPPRWRNHLLTLAGPNIVYCSNAGAVVAVDSATGNRVWAMRYPSRGVKTRDGRPSPRNLCPPLSVASGIIIAPADIDRIYCLDPLTGHTEWERDGMEIVHVVGVCQERVVFSTATGLQALNLGTGDDIVGWRQPLVGNVATLGRPFIADAWVFWPTVDDKLRWRAINIFDGNLVRGLDSIDTAVLRPLPAGNAAFGHGCMVIATGDELMGYVPPQLPIGPPRT
jgi:outer membrane protein assembly factor BamB